MLMISSQQLIVLGFANCLMYLVLQNEDSLLSVMYDAWCVLVDGKGAHLTLLIQLPLFRSFQGHHKVCSLICHWTVLVRYHTEVLQTTRRYYIHVIILDCLSEAGRCLQTDLLPSLLTHDPRHDPDKQRVCARNVGKV